MIAIRTSVAIALTGSMISALLGVGLGFATSHFGGLVERTILMLIDLQASMPFMLFALALFAALGNSPVLLVIVLGFFGWERTARITRGLALSAMSEGYAQFAWQIGAHPFRINTRHILPDIVARWRSV
ncbi:ABC transporter permease subunit [Rhizobium leguminosarum]|uniref:ABC transporter permease subunit n=1 Tax=Rhizobium leguminosarum TaxID=384 RepID=UPI0028F435D1|nr:ABC transporter permease subunit [Rhizobium leguminosarum]